MAPSPDKPEHASERPGSTTQALAAEREALKAGDDLLAERFRAGDTAGVLVRDRARLIDECLLRSWRLFGLDKREHLALVAVGGYGRGELHPCSDVDILVLTDSSSNDDWQLEVERFLRFLWDLGLDLGHSVRTVEQCRNEALADVTTATNLMEARYLTGAQLLFENMRARTGPDRLWPGPEFFAAKWEEQRERHARFHDTAYNLEPNIKEGPGGLRDIQMIGWVARRHFGADTLHDLVVHGFLTEAEHDALSAGQEHLWRIRYGLHLIAGRREDRLLFEFQPRLAEAFGLKDEHEENLGVEQFMQAYYRTVIELERLNEMLLQLYQETLLLHDASEEAVPINPRFQARRGFLEASDASVFTKSPEALMELFLLLQEHPDLKGVRATTIRAVRENRHRIDDEFRASPVVTRLFLDVLRQPAGVYTQLRRMNRYGILSRYVAPFGRIVGRMQYDLFHEYTVDQHSLFCVRNLRHFSDPESVEDFPLAHRIFGTIEKPELLYLAGLFHDIAKGRGGDHSELGAEDAAEFCAQHGMDEDSVELLAWLVRNHLLMSVTAQKRDISDPDVVAGFARKVSDLKRLGYLYLLTVADIRATSPRLWNAWKDSLLAELYDATEQMLLRGVATPLSRVERVARRREDALALLGDHDQGKVIALWDTIPTYYFLPHDPEQIAWHTREALSAVAGESLVAARPSPRRGTTEVFVFAPDQDGLFATIAASLDRMRLNVMEARVFTSSEHMAVDSFHVLHGETGERDPDRIRHTLGRDLAQAGGVPPAVSRRLTRRMRHFALKTRVSFGEETPEGHTLLEVIASDRPGLLSQIAQALVQSGVRIHGAKIATFGNRVEDFFFVTDRHDRPLSSQAQKDGLRMALTRRLDGDND